VVIPHRALGNFLSSMAEVPGIGEHDRVLAVTTLSFDIAVLELLLPLTAGATVVLASHEEALYGDAIADLIDEHQITLMQTTPSRWQLLIDSGWAGSSPMRALCGGEPLPPALANALRSRCRELWNMYGPTETTVWSSCTRIELPAPACMPLGAPIANTSILVLDDYGNLCPVGVPGEIHIGGDGVALGYHQRPEQTQKRFVADPTASSALESRLFRTGDRGRWRADGTLEHLGRLDQQVKVRGYRIELGEIEGRLTEHPAVLQAVAVVRGSEPKTHRLVAYVVGNGAPPDAGTLLAHLRRSLPTFMLPQHIVALDEIPTLPNGKANRAALPDPEPMSGPADYVRPRSPAERALWEIWSDLLGVRDFGVTDNFFELGGHSILAVLLTQRIEERLNIHCGLSLLFRCPTIESLCVALETDHRLRHSDLVALQPEGSEPPLFFLYGVDTYRALAQRLGSNRPVYGMIVPSELTLLQSDDVGGAVPSVEQLATEYLTLIRRRQPCGPYHLAGFSIGGVLAFEVAQRLRAEGEQIGMLAMIDSGYPRQGQRSPLAWLKKRLQRLRDEGPGYLWRVARVRLNRHLLAGRAEAGLATQTRQTRALNARRHALHSRAMRRYVPEPYPGRALYLRGDGDQNMESAGGWRSVMPRLDVRGVPGRHMEILRSPQVDVLARELTSHLASLDVRAPKQGRCGGN
jgi:thioesterase domain-containing protein